MSVPDEFIADLHAKLLEYYRLNGMDRPLRLNGGIQEPFHSSQCTCRQCLANSTAVVKKEAQGEVRATVIVNTAPPVAVRPVPNPYGRLKVNVLATRRIGDEERNKVLDQLQEMFVKGHLTQAELDARQEAALAARVAAELEFLVRDLPPAPRIKEPELPPQQWSPPIWLAYSYISVIMGLLAITLIVMGAAAVGPAVILAMLSVGGFMLMVARNRRK